MTPATTRWPSARPGLLSLDFAIYETQGRRCALTGLRFDLRIIGSGKARRPFAPSLDRIDSTGGYMRDNVRLVCQAVNFALNAYGEDTFRESATAVRVTAIQTQIDRKRQDRSVLHAENLRSRDGMLPTRGPICPVSVTSPTMAEPRGRKTLDQVTRPGDFVAKLKSTWGMSDKALRKAQTAFADEQ